MTGKTKPTSDDYGPVAGYSGRGFPERGQSLVEFGFAAIVILLAMFGAIDLGLTYLEQITLRAAAREGAIYGSIAPDDVSGIRAHVRAASENPVDLSALTDDEIIVEVIGEACEGNSIRVEVKSDHVLITPFFFGKAIRLSAEATNTILMPICQGG
jgi:hypothetical protein